MARFARRAHILCEGVLPRIDFPMDPDDAHVVAAALACRAHWLVTGDHHLLDARLGIPCEILTVAEALRRATDLLRRSQP